MGIEAIRETARHRQSGQAAVEVALLAPWIFFLFVGIFDFGYYAYAAICTQNAARAAATQTAANPGAQLDTIACLAAWNELSMLSNVNLATPPTTCGGLPAALSVSRKTLCDQTKVQPSVIVCEAANPADYTQDNTAASSQVAVTYQSIPMIPIPGLLAGQISLTRVAEMRILYQ